MRKRSKTKPTGKEHKQSKVRIGKKRYGLMGAVLLGVAVTAVAMIRLICDHTETVEQEKLLDYTTQSSASYEVWLIPNDYVAGEKQGMDENYIRNLIDHVDVTASASYQGSAKADLSGDCTVKVWLRGYQMDDGEKDIIWEKNMGVLTDKPVDEEGKQYGITQTVSLKLDDYEAAADAAMEELGVSSSLEVAVELQGNLSVEKDGKKQEIPLEAAVYIPLTAGRFQIEHTKDVSGADTLTKEQIIPAEPQRSKLILLGVLLTVLVLLFFILLFFTGDYSTEQKKSKKLDAVFRTYGGQLTSLLVYPKEDGTEVYQVDGIRELLKVAKELHRPIFYASEEKPHGRVLYFFVQEEKRRYLYGELLE